jgi:hypothetical protein
MKFLKSYTNDEKVSSDFLLANDETHNQFGSWQLGAEIDTLHVESATMDLNKQKGILNEKQGLPW